MSNRICVDAIDKYAEELSAVAKNIWDNPEMGWNEKNAVEKTKALLENHGFTVEVGAYGIPTAIRAVWGKGKPVVGFCGEYDCLPGLSQKVSTKQDPVVPGGIGHGCGHNLLGVGCAAACIGLKEELEATGKDATIIFYGCPAEEQLIGKGSMAKQGAFAECDFTLHWHPGSSNAQTVGTMTGVNGAIFHFKGKTAHAAGNPFDGRSALDAVQLMNIGVEFLREHVTSDVRMHYRILEGGLAPNIVPDSSSVKYFVRALDMDVCNDAFERVKQCARGAAMMTGTELEIEFLGGIYPTLQNKVLTEALQEAREAMPYCEYTEEELKFADEINKTSPAYTDKTPPIDYETRPLANINGYGSTDYGDVQHIVPGAMISEATSCTLAGGHSWKVTACSGSSIGMKGMIRAGKIMAVATMKMIENPDLVEKAKEEFKAAMAGKQYVCPITDDVYLPFKK